MKKKFLNILILLLFLSSFILSPVYSQSADDLQDQLDQKNQEVKNKESELDRIKRDIANITSSAASLDEKISLINKEMDKVSDYISGYEKEVIKKSSEVAKKQSVLDFQKKQLNDISYLLYKVTRAGVLEYFFLNNSSDGIAQNLFYKQYLLSQYIENFKNKRLEYAQLNSEKQKLEQEKKDLEGQIKEMNGLIASLTAQKSNYQSQIYAKSTQSTALKKQIGLLKDQISDLQVAILVAKSGATTGIGNVPSSGDYDATYAGFLAKAPSGSFETFSFGAYTHRRGMSQYGAQARAAIGKQSYTQILSAYYGKTPVKKNTSGTIKVEGYGSMDFETKYLYGIAEMPASWDLQALKAQAVAARTYAYSYYYNKTAICTTQSCQVWSNDKYLNTINGAAPNWKKAVDETKGEILSGVNAYYSAISGGYLVDSGWDTTNKKGGTGAWTTNAWESMANSPWFYKSWYTETYNDSSAKCNRKPWMTQEEMSDILNTYLVVKGQGLKGSVDTARIVPVTLPVCKISGLSGNPYSMSDMKNLLVSPVTSISGNPVVTNNNQGSTTSVSFSTNRGVVTISGADYKQIYNMRAPGYMSIPQNDYVFINVVRK